MGRSNTAVRTPRVKDGPAVGQVLVFLQHCFKKLAPILNHHAEVNQVVVVQFSVVEHAKPSPEALHRVLSHVDIHVRAYKPEACIVW